MFKYLLSTYRAIVYFGLLLIGFSAVFIYRYTINNEYSFTYSILAENGRTPDTPEINNEIPENEAKIQGNEAEKLLRKAVVAKAKTLSAEDAFETKKKTDSPKPFEEKKNGKEETDKQYFELIKRRFERRKEILRGNCTQPLPENIRILNSEASYYVGRYRTYFCVSAKVMKPFLHFFSFLV